MLKAENLVPKQRFFISSAVIILLSIILIGRFYYLQIYQHENFSRKAESNRIRAVTLPAPRGLILDRNQKILVDNYPTYILYGIPSEIRDLQENISIISEATGIKSSILNKNYEKYYRGRFAPVTLVKSLTIEQLSRLEEAKNQLQGIVYKQFPERFFTKKLRASHALGYLKEIDKKTLQSFGENSQMKYGDLVGGSGLEKEYEELLQGEKGIEFFEVDAYGREARKISADNARHPHPGQNLHTTLDIDLQRLLENEFKGKKGAGIVSNPKTGGILAFLSSPDYSPDLFTGLIEEQEWASIIGDSGRPLLNRASNGTYPPGSIFKMIVMAALMDQDLVANNWETNCTGSYEYGDRTFNCWEEFGHGAVNLEKALIQSCDVYFYRVIQRLNINKLAEYSRLFGLGRATEIDLPSEMLGRVPDRSYLNRLYGRRGWARGNLLNLSIGQGELLVTPIQMAVYINYLATRGNTPKLHFIDLLPESFEKYSVVNLKNNIWSVLEKAMEKVITDEKGTGRAADPHIPGLKIAGKTSTAENPHGEPHAWFIAYGEKDDNLISLVLLVENGGHGGETCAPIAQKIFAKYFADNSFTMTNK